MSGGRAPWCLSRPSGPVTIDNVDRDRSYRASPRGLSPSRPFGRNETQRARILNETLNHDVVPPIYVLYNRLPRASHLDPDLQLAFRSTFRSGPDARSESASTTYATPAHSPRAVDCRLKVILVLERHKVALLILELDIDVVGLLAEFCSKAVYKVVEGGAGDQCYPADILAAVDLRESHKLSPRNGTHATHLHPDLFHVSILVLAARVVLVSAPPAGPACSVARPPGHDVLPVRHPRTER